MLDLDAHFALGVFAAGDVANLEVAQLDLHAGDPFDGLENRIDRPVAASSILDLVAVHVLQTDGGHGQGARSGARVKALQRPQGRPLVNLGLGQDFDVGVINHFLPVRQGFEALEHVLELGFVQMITQFADALAECVPAAVLA